MADHGRSLPAEAFTSPSIYEREVGSIFTREWLCAGRADQIPTPGDYFTIDLLDDLLVVVRDANDEVRVLSRVCRHRGAEIVRGAGNTRSFQCPYHAWTYRLDGRLQGAPLMERAEGFDRESCRLPELRSELWEGWIFVNFDAEADPLGPRLAPLSALLAPYRMSEMVSIETAVFDSPFNWKVLTDNFMEAYHHIATHRDTLEPFFPARLSHTPDNEGPYSVLVMPGKPDQGPLPATLPLVGALDEDQQAALIAASVFPLHLFAPSAHFLTWYQLLPESCERFTLRIFQCFPREVLEDPSLADPVREAQEITKQIHIQDIAACEATWAGLGARSYDPGLLAPLEKPIGQFNRWWTERMGCER